MRKKSRVTELKGASLEFLRDGKAAPESLLRRHRAEARRRTEAWLREKNEVRREAARYWSKIRKPVPPPAGKQAARAMAGLRGITERLAKRNLVAPKVPAEESGLLGYSVRLAPPYSFGYIDGDLTGPGNLSSVDVFSGEMRCNFFVDKNDGLYHYVRVQMGAVLRTPPQAASVRVSVNPSYAFAWWINSFGHDGGSAAELILGITGYGGGKTQVGASDTRYLWAEDAYENASPIAFDWGSDSGVPMVAQMYRPDSEYIFVSMTGHISGGASNAPSPGTQLGGILNVTVPSFTLDVRTTPLVEAV